MNAHLTAEQLRLIRVGFDNDIRQVFVAEFVKVCPATVSNYYRKWRGSSGRRYIANAKRQKPKSPDALSPINRLMAGR